MFIRDGLRVGATFQVVPGYYYAYPLWSIASEWILCKIFGSGSLLFVSSVIPTGVALPDLA